MRLQFTKMHGLGNDFIIINNLRETGKDFSQLALDKCRRRFSIGADGILVIGASEIADLKMEIFNSDGSIAGMCGNGIRCFARHVFERGILPKKSQSIETLAGIIKPTLVDNPERPGDYLVRVDMGEPLLSRSKVPMMGPDSPQVMDEIMIVQGEEITFTALSMGNPHCIIFVDEITDRMVRELGPMIERADLFPEKTNVEFIKVIDRGKIRMRVWERGAGETLACGTGACASVVAGRMKQILDEKVQVLLPGGDLWIEWGVRGNVFMTGPAETAFDGWIEN